MTDMVSVARREQARFLLALERAERRFDEQLIVSSVRFRGRFVAVQGAQFGVTVGIGATELDFVRAFEQIAVQTDPVLNIDAFPPGVSPWRNWMVLHYCLGASASELDAACLEYLEIAEFGDRAVVTVTDHTTVGEFDVSLLGELWADVPTELMFAFVSHSAAMRFRTGG